jgi:N6-L-threonylcarbamoyladenine synthase
MLTANKVLILSLDNAAMIAWASMNRFLAGDTDPDDLEIRAQWSIEDLQDIVSPIH